MSISQYLSKFALGVNAQGVLSAAKGGTGSTTGAASTTPTVSAISYSGDDTATLPAGGATVTLTGTNFAVGAKVLINSTQVSVVTRVSSTQLTFTAPAMSVGTYILYVVNPDGGTAIGVPGIEYSNTPSWTTASGSLGDVSNSGAVNISVAATGDGTISYSVASGTLPTGVTLNSSTGVLSGTAPNISNTTTYNFVIRATDAQNQDTDRSFSLNVVVVNSPTAVDFLVVGGGGGGGDTAGGGGGAGGYLTSVGNSGSTDTYYGGGSPALAPLSVTPGVTYTVTVGAGGTRYNDATSNSVFSTITALGGGGGDWATGGSGGGGSGFGSGTYPSGSRGGGDYSRATSGQGTRGGAGFYGSGTTPGGGGGGGGANEAGANGYYWTAGGGGSGIQSSITGTATYYAGGGGGGASAYGSGGAGGSGGGGAGAINSAGANGSPGTANTGGGGGGGHGRNTDYAGAGYGANGGSGIVVIRYADSYAAAASTTGSPTITTSGGYRVYKFTSSGSITF